MQTRVLGPDLPLSVVEIVLRRYPYERAGVSVTVPRSNQQPGKFTQRDNGVVHHQGYLLSSRSSVVGDGSVGLPSIAAATATRAGAKTRATAGARVRPECINRHAPPRS